MKKTADSYDAVVVGAGAGGAAAAWKLVTDGARVLVLETGPRYDPGSDYRLDKPDWERTTFPDKVPIAGRQTYAELQELDSRWDDLRSWSRVRGRAVTGSRRRAVGYSHVVGVGGSTLHFTGEAHRMHPEAMKMHSRFGVAADWPMSYDDLQPYYELAERIIGVAGPDSDRSRPRRSPYPLPAHPLAYASTRLGAGFEAAGMSWQANSLAALSKPYDGRPACNYCAGCTRGCPRRDKGSADVTFMAKAEASGRCSVRTGAQVLRLETGTGDRIDHLIIADGKGRQEKIPTRAVVLACGAVETPRLLLNSAGPGAPQGLGNESGLVGRNFMDTLSWTATGLYPEPLGSWRGQPSDLISWHYNAPDAIDGVIGGCRFSTATAESDLVGPYNHARRITGGWGREHHRQMRETFGKAISLGAIGECLPNDGTFVDLDPAEKDSRGLPKARIHARRDEADLLRLQFMADTVRRVLRAAGVTEIVEEVGRYDLFAATHVFGTCRMGADPAESVVDGYGRSHRWRNLMIADGSLFPSSGGGESPSLTINALAIRAGEALAGELRRGDL